MKKKLLKPPQNDGQIIFLPDPAIFSSFLKEETRIGTAHQPYFFNPGVSLKFIFLDNLPQKNKEIIFLDTDRISIKVNVPSKEGFIYPKEFINTKKVLYNYPAPSKDRFLEFFSSLEEAIKNSIPQYSQEILSNLATFKEIILTKKYKFLKEVLADSFLEFYGIKRDYCFVSDVIRQQEFRYFFEKIYNEDTTFKEIFNTTLDDYRREFRFRYKNFPFPKLQNDELPFWIVKDGERKRCFKKDLHLSDFKKYVIVPRASTLTIFLRLYRFDFFIHGVGGSNYEWVANRVIEKFFKKRPPLFAVVSGTFFINDLRGREFPYFFYNPLKIKLSLTSFLWEKNTEVIVSP